MRACYVLGLVPLLLIVGCESPEPGGKRIDALEKTSENFKENMRLIKALESAEIVAIHEGLPHPSEAKGVFEAEAANKETKRMHGYAFYKGELAVSKDDLAKLHKLISAESTYHEFRGEKKCGGFHPDFAVDLKADGKMYRVLLCFGCHEAKIFTSDAGLRCDLHSEAYRSLTELLRKYHKNVPKSNG